MRSRCIRRGRILRRGRLSRALIGREGRRWRRRTLIGQSAFLLGRIGAAPGVRLLILRLLILLLRRVDRGLSIVRRILRNSTLRKSGRHSEQAE
jgi:hypothetical protein